jgi:apolipoprotein N-acyltransferase
MTSTAPTPIAWRNSTLGIALAGSLLMAAALPPLAFGWLGWIAPVPWLMLIRRDELTGRRPYGALYLAGLVFWLLAIHWLRLPHPMTYLGWFALSAYLAVYVPAFVGLSRVAVHRLAVPLWLAAPIVWTGLELARAHMLTGFLMASLAHTQVKWTALIQVSDVFGEYGVDFIVMLVAACIAECLFIVTERRGSASRPNRALRDTKSFRLLVTAAPALAVLAMALAYGQMRLSQAAAAQQALQQRGPRIALIQGNTLSTWKADPDRESQIMKDYIRLSEQAIAANSKNSDARPVDLVVWPETMYRSPLRDFAAGYQLPTEVNATTDEIESGDRRQLASLAAHLGVPILVGVDRFHLVADGRSATSRPTIQAFNSAVLVEPDGTVVGTYDKMHRVMFGEYIPFADWVPFLYQLTPLTGGIVAGADAAALRTASGHVVAPNICYETAIPHVIRRQVATLSGRNERPSVLVNLTNDAWYWGSSELDMHLACDVFRAVETRMPLVIAANGGISASIDSMGRVQHRCGKQVADFIVADVEPGVLTSPYVRFGDWFAGICLACCIFLAIFEWRTRRALRNRTVPPPADR